MKANKGPHGWNVSQVVEHGGKAWSTCTMKRYSGRIVSTATECTVVRCNGCTSTIIECDAQAMPAVTHYATRATEKTIEAAHAVAMKEWGFI